MTDYWTKVRQDLWTKYRGFTFLPTAPIIQIEVTDNEEVDLAYFKALRINALHRYTKECQRYQDRLKEFDDSLKL